APAQEARGGAPRLARRDAPAGRRGQRHPQREAAPRFQRGEGSQGLRPANDGQGAGGPGGGERRGRGGPRRRLGSSRRLAYADPISKITIAPTRPPQNRYPSE